MKQFDFKQINQLHAKLKNIKYINSGGCGHFAFYLTKKLRQLRIKHEIIIFDSDISINKKKKIIKKYKEKVYSECICEAELATNHVTIKIDNYYIDGQYIFKNSEKHWFNYNFGKITLPDLETMLEGGMWNYLYNIDDNPKIEKIIKKIIK